MSRPPIPNRAAVAQRRSLRRRGVGSTLIGIFIGLVAGLGLAAGVAYWLMKNNPSLPLPPFAKDARESRDATRTGKGDAPDKPRFDFYKILPGIEEPKVAAERKPAERGDRAVVEQAKEKAADKNVLVTAEKDAARAPEKVANAEPAGKTVKAGERFWLQAGSFGAVTDAENLK